MSGEAQVKIIIKNICNYLVKLLYVFCIIFKCFYFKRYKKIISKKYEKHFSPRRP